MQIEHLNKETTDGTVRNLDALYQLFPSCFTEAPDALGKVHRAVDWGKLRELLGEYVEDGEPEKYDFTWVGKRAAQREAAAPCRKTLRPCPEESVDWDTTQNLYIEGDNLEVLKLLQNSYMGKVKMIYIDPPYNTGKDFVYHDDYKVSSKEYDERNFDEDGMRFRKNTDGDGRFHSDWCSMMYARLVVSRSLLKKDGAIFISIDDSEIINLRKMCDEIFGSSNFIAQFTRKGSGGRQDSTYFAIVHEYVLCYAKDSSLFISGKEPKEDDNYPFTDETGKRYKLQLLRKWGENSRRIDRPNLYYPITDPDGNDFYPMLNETDEGCWRWGKETMFNNIERGLVEFKKKNEKWQAYEKIYEPNEGEEKTKLYTTIIDDISNSSGASLLKEIFNGKVFDYPKPVDFVSRIIQFGNTTNDDIIMDFFSGSATTAHSVMQLSVNDGKRRRYIMVQLDTPIELNSDASTEGYKNICEIGKERIRRAGKKIKADSPLTTQDLDIGFRVLKCDESNYKPVAFAPKDYTQESLDMFLDNIKEERTGLDLLFDCMMRWGLELSLPYETQKVDGCTIYNVDDGNLVACFDGVVTSAVIDAIAETHPLRVVFRDSSFTEAAQKMNLFELFKQKCGWTDQEVQNNVRVI